MKKYFLSFAVLLGMVGLLKAEQLYSPSDQTGNVLNTADYTGYSYSTGAFTSTHVTAAIPLQGLTGPQVAPGVFVGVIFSSGVSEVTNFVDVFDSTDTRLNTAAICRLYNINGSTSPLMGGIAAGPVTPPTGPIHFKNGLIWRAGVATYNNITVIFRKY